uniref:Putative nicotinic acetylcholine receptor 6 n=1 Tax=Hirudo verbana TaxID=311461 RepID=A0A2S1WLU6_9ANNE|nr:putative nicotinic acetylcholine receptor 6 [Hirudo verbana]
MILTLTLDIFVLILLRNTLGSPDSKRLYDDLLKKSGYNKLIRPVGNNSDTLTVKIGLRLSQIIDVDEKNQIMTTNVWLDQQWFDYRLTWHAEEYGGADRLFVPSDEIWLPDIVLYNSADGNFTVKLMTKATIYSNGLVMWKPPAVYKSLCFIDVEFFPFDEQSCTLKIGSWTYDGYSVDIRHKDLPLSNNPLDVVDQGIDLSDYCKSTEWDLLAVPAKKFVKYYPCCEEPYPDIKFNITIRRKTLFYTVNLILPCVAICSVTLLVFYIPASSGEKITMGITILNSLNIFLLLVAEINPPTSLATPLIGKYLLFTMVLVTCSIIVTVFVLNIHFRSPSTHVMSPWIRELFLNVLPRLLLMRQVQTKILKVNVRTEFGSEYRDSFHLSAGENIFNQSRRQTESHSKIEKVDRSIGFERITRELSPSRFATIVTPSRPGLFASPQQDIGNNSFQSLPSFGISCQQPLVENAMLGVNFISDHVKQQDDFQRIKHDWQYVAMVLDRLFLWVFTAACLVGTFGIIVQAPTLYDYRTPLFTSRCT